MANLFPSVTRPQAILGVGMLIVYASAGCAWGARWGIFGFHLMGPPPWWYAIAASVGGVIFFLSPMRYGLAAATGARPGQGGDDPSRPLLLYLRPFEADLGNALQLAVGATCGVFVWLSLSSRVWAPFGLLPLFLNVTHEQRLQDALVSFGTLVAFALPRSRLQPLGARRERLDDGWRQELERYLARARLVIVRPGSTDSIRWEVGEVLKTVPRERILFDLRLRGSVARRRETYDDFRAQVRRSLGVELPERLARRCYLVIDAGGVPHFFRPSNRPADLVRLVLWGDFNRDRLAPALEPIGIRLPPSPQDRVTRASRLFFHVCVYIFVAVVLVALGVMGLLLVRRVM